MSPPEDPAPAHLLPLLLGVVCFPDTSDDLSASGFVQGSHPHLGGDLPHSSFDVHQDTTSSVLPPASPAKASGHRGPGLAPSQGKSPVDMELAIILALEKPPEIKSSVSSNPYPSRGGERALGGGGGKSPKRKHEGPQVY